MGKWIAALALAAGLVLIVGCQKTAEPPAPVRPQTANTATQPAIAGAVVGFVAQPAAEQAETEEPAEQQTMETPEQSVETPPVEEQPAPPDSQETPDCIQTAAYVSDVTIPDGTSFKQVVPFVKTWRIKNAGTCTWNSEYRLIFHSGAQMDGPLSVNFPNEVPPGEMVDLSVDLKSPAGAGEFTGFWEFQDPSGKRFGVNSNGIDLIWVKIGVSIFDEAGQPVPVVGAENPVVTPQGCAAQENGEYEQQILALINAARAENGLPPLALEACLSKAAFNHSSDMGCSAFVDHTGSDGSTWYRRIEAQGYAYSYASENIYVGNPAFGGDANGAFTWWMNSPIHRDNILNPKMTEIGIGVAMVANSPYGGYFTLDFGRPK